MKVVLKGSSESSRVMLRERDPSPKGRKGWRGQAAQVCNKITKKLVKAKPTL